MNTQSVGQLSVWAVLLMEMGLALPVISLPAQGQTRPGLLGPVLLVALLPLGHVSVRRWHELRDPSWRLLVGIALVLAARAAASSISEPDMRGLALWLGQAFAPAALGIALWWRGTSIGFGDMTAADVRTEFSIVAVAALGVLAILRPFILADPLLLVSSVGLCSVGGLLATALARQDAAHAGSSGPGRALAVVTGLMPVGAAGVMATILRPDLLASFWLLVARAIELLLLPIGLFVAWLSSLLPKGGAPAPLTPLPPPVFPRLDPALLDQLGQRNEWLGYVVLLGVLLFATTLILLLVRLMLEHWLTPPTLEPEHKHIPELIVERSGSARTSGRALLAWLKQLLGSRRTHAPRLPASGQAGPTDAWAAYRVLLEWADRQGLGRRPAETTRQLQARLAHAAPEARDTVTLVTGTFELERYGAVRPADERLRRIERALRVLMRR